MKKIFFTSCFLACLFPLCFGQSVKLSAEAFHEEMKPVLSQLNRENIVLRFKKEVFPDAKATAPIESTKGVIYRGTGISYKMITGGITVLQTKEHAIYIDSAEQFVQVSDIDSTMKALNMNIQFTDEMLSQYDLEKTTYSGYIVLKATPKYSNEGILEFYIDSKKKSLYKLIISMPPANYFMEREDDETIESPYVTIVYEPIVALKKNEVSFSDEAILVKSSENNLSLTPTMAAYQLHDARYRVKK